jgi:hypothetical protein
MRIAISGAAGCGKTTLIDRVSKEIDIFIVPEFSRQILHAHHITKPTQYPEDLGGAFGFQREVITRKHVAEADFVAQGKPYIGDRPLLDCGAYTLFFYAQDERQDQVMELVELTTDWSKNIYEMIFLRPFDYSHGMENDGIRSIKMAYQKTVYALILGLLVQHNIPYTIMPHDLDKSFEMLKDYITGG